MLKSTAVWRYVPAEARRNRVLYKGWPLIIAGSLPFAAAVAGAMDIPVGQCVAGTLAAWVVAGLPLTALFFGAVAGAGLRGPSEEAEAPWPLSPAQRAFGALAAAAAALVGNAALVAALLLATSEGTRDFIARAASWGNWDDGSFLLAVYDGGWLPRVGHAAAMSGIAASSLAWLLTASFTAAYAASHAILGGVAAVAGAGLLILPVAAGALLFLNHGPHLAIPFLAVTSVLTAASAVGAALALARTAPATARSVRLPWPRLALTLLLPLCGTLGAWPMLWSSRTRVMAHLERVWGGWDKKDMVASQREERSRGLMTGVGGRLIRQTPGGDVVLLPGSNPTLGELVRYSSWELPRVTNAFSDRTGRFWAEVRLPSRPGAPTLREVWTGNGNDQLARYTTLPPDMELVVYDGLPAVDGTPYVVTDNVFFPIEAGKPPVLKRR